MKKFFAVLKREYLTRVKTKGFIFGLIMTPLFMLAIFMIPILVSFMRADDQRKFAVIDLSDRVYEKLNNALAETNEKGQRLFAFERVTTHSAEERKRLLAEIEAEKLDGLLIIPEKILADNKMEYYARNVSNFQQNRDLRNAVTAIIQEMRIVAHGLSAQFAQDFARRVDFETYRVDADGKEKKDAGASYLLTYGLVMFLYICMLSYGASITQAVLEEKTSRVVELIISSVRPFQLMLGKILGVGGVGLTQFIIWSLLAGLISAYAGTIASWFNSTNAPALPVISPMVLIYFVLYFVLGYFLYATMYAAVGAIVNSSEEAQALQFPVTMILVVPILLVNFVINNPNANSSVMMSFVPFFLPILMFARVATDMPSTGELLLSLAVMLLAIYLMIMVVGKIFRVGILMYGKRPTLPEVLRWVRY